MVLQHDRHALSNAFCKIDFGFNRVKATELEKPIHAWPKLSKKKASLAAPEDVRLGTTGRDLVYFSLVPLSSHTYNAEVCRGISFLGDTPNLYSMKIY